MRARVRIGIVCLAAAALAGFVGFASTPVALSDGTYSWQTAPDSVVAGFVTSPSTSEEWAGAAFGAGSIFAFTTGSYNTAAAGNVLGTIFNTALDVGLFADPWTAGAYLALGIGGGLLEYSTSNYWTQWLTPDSVPSSSAPCGQGNSLGSDCRLVSVAQGAKFCIGFNSSGQSLTWTAPSAGLILELNTGYELGSFAGYCSSGYYPASVAPSWSSTQAQHESAINALNPSMSSYEVDTGLHYAGSSYPIDIWFDPSLPSDPSDIEAKNGQHTNEGPFPASNPNATTSAIADAFRNKLSADTTAASTVSCVISGDCETTSIAPTFTMPDCYGLSTSDCLFDMQMAGFTGTLQTSIAGTADYTQPAGVVISTDPAALATGVSTAASTIADAYTNAQSCQVLSVDNPHWSTNSTPNTMLSYINLQCNFTGDATFAATMYQCASDPGTDGVNLATADCVVAASTSLNNSTPVTADASSRVYVPWVQEGDQMVSWGPGYWITTATTTTADVFNGPEVWSQGGWQPPPP